MNGIPVQDFDLSSTLESGQVFRYVRLGQRYLVHEGDRVFEICQRGHLLYFEGTDEGFITHYLGLDQNYRKIMRSLGGDTTLKRAMDLYWGLRILRQDPWQCLISFLSSSVKNINHIKVILERLCRAFGERVSIGNYQGYAFPRQGTLDDLERLGVIGLGFRAPYIYEVNRIVSQGFFETIRQKSYGEAKALLTGLPGVGEKIADCVLLFAMGFPQAFPIDIWIKRGMEETYFGAKKTSPSKINAFAQQHFGPYAGYAQQYLYHYWRETGRALQSGGATDRRHRS